jgi:hypothetical protein
MRVEVGSPKILFPWIGYGTKEEWLLARKLSILALTFEKYVSDFVEILREL